MKKNAIEIHIGMATCGRAAGAQAVFDAVKQEAAGRSLNVDVIETGCIGMCSREVLLDVTLPGRSRVTYGNVTPAKVAEIFEDHIQKGEVVTKLLIAQFPDEPKRLYPDVMLYGDLPFLAKQKRHILARCGRINPERIDDYLEAGGYQALGKALKMGPEWIIDEIEESGLRGRGGGGFLTSLKWEFCRSAESDVKYMICNADEGDPGAFMDRSLLESDPHVVIEGMIIGCYAIGARDAYIYVRSEYPLAVERLKKAISQAEAKGYLGENIMGSGFSCHIKIKKGSGAFVCGEETALIASIEGKRGMPRPRPPFPAEKGLWGKPTNINNVETFGNVPWIILNGGKTYAQTGTVKSKGTKIFALTGKVKNTGLVEVAMGITIGEIINEIGGGIIGGKKFKAVQMGGPSGGCLDSSHLNTPIDYDSLTEAGAIMGSGGCVVMDEGTCMVDIARYFMDFIQNESCGKCVPCRVGTKRMLEILTRICDGEGTENDLVLLEELAHGVKATALCGLGKTASNPVLSTFRYFKDEFLSHIREKRCPARVCKKLIKYRVTAEKCKACSLCVKVCPSHVITGGSKGVPALIHEEKCVRCGACLEKCPTKAISICDINEATAKEVLS
jgi:NADH:ubiquinone oxidoreductase subunit F (NADH-binding)/NAD-dependent dihydropyrimidine dehydrogenase PreA subunit/(2Fe-2S) ferredoxin